MAQRRWEVIADLANKHGYTRGVEVGVLKGRNLNELLKRVPDLHMTAVDMAWTQEAWRVFGSHRDRIRPLNGPSVVMAAQVENQSVNFVFIDADHAYEAVRADIAAWLPKIKPGGMIAGHDYGLERHTGVKAAVDEAFKTVTVHDDYVWTVQV